MVMIYDHFHTMIYIKYDFKLFYIIDIDFISSY